MDTIMSGLWRFAYGFLEKFGLVSLKHAAQILLLSLAAGNFLTGTLKGLGFSYWRYFQSFRYLLVLGGFWLHYNIGLSFGGMPWINTILFYFCISYISMYLVDFAWFAGNEKLQEQSTTNKIIAVALLCISSLLIAAKLHLLTMAELTFHIYVGAILVASLLSAKATLAQGLIVVIISLMMKFVSLHAEDNWKLSIVFHIIFLAFSLDRQGKQAGVSLLETKDYPASTYLFWSAICIYLYFVLMGQLQHAEYVAGVIYLETVIVAGLRNGQ